MNITYRVAGGTLILFGVLWALYARPTIRTATKDVVLAAGLDGASALWIYPFFFAIWFGGNILLGNMMGIQAIIQWLNTLNSSGGFALDTWIIATIAVAPSVAQWWLKEFQPPINKTYWATWALIGADVTLSAFGFWVLVDMPLDFTTWKAGHWIALCFALALAGFVNIYCENMVHDALARIMKWLKGKKIKGAV